MRAQERQTLMVESQPDGGFLVLTPGRTDLGHMTQPRFACTTVRELLVYINDVFMPPVPEKKKKRA